MNVVFASALTRNQRLHALRKEQKHLVRLNKILRCVEKRRIGSAYVALQLDWPERSVHIPPGFAT